MLTENVNLRGNSRQCKDITLNICQQVCILARFETTKELFTSLASRLAIVPGGGCIPRFCRVTY